MTDLHLGTELGSGQPLRVTSDILDDGTLVVGAPGSGKTGLGRRLLEACMGAGRPFLAIDTTGDLSARVAERHGVELARGLEFADDSSLVRLRSLGSETVGAVFTYPGSADAELAHDLTAAFLALLGYRPRARGPEFTLIEAIVFQQWSAGQNLGLDELIAYVLEPPIRRIGVFDIDAVISLERRQDLAAAIEGIKGDPGFEEGRIVPIDASALLSHPDGVPATVVTFSSRSPNFRRFILASVLAHVRRADPKLRPVVSIDEATDFLPPNQSTVASRSIRELLVTSSATGADVILVADSLDLLPMDLDEQCETWIVGRLPVRTNRRAAVEALDLVDPPVDEEALDEEIAELGEGQFILRSSRLDRLVTFAAD